MRIAIVDDDVNWQECVRNEIIKYDTNDEIEIETFSDGESYLLNDRFFDISFVDIEMPGIDGFMTIEQAKNKNPDGIYAILTTHVELSRRGYMVNAFRYIDKACLVEIHEAINSAKIILGRNEKIEVNVIGEGVRKIALKNIIYIETEKHYVLIHTHQRTLKCSNRMKDIEDMLQDKWFCRCHNAFIVNLDEIVRLEDTIAYLSNGENIDISHRKLNQFRKQYINRQYECANA